MFHEDLDHLFLIKINSFGGNNYLLINKIFIKGIINVGGKPQSVLKFARKFDKKVKAINIIRIFNIYYFYIFKQEIMNL